MMDKKKKPMSPPPVQKTVADRYTYPVLDTPPAVQAQARCRENSAGERIYSLNYAGMDIASITVSDRIRSCIRFYSDSSMQTSPLIQQFYLSAESPVKAVVTLHMRHEAICLRPRRAGDGEAIFAQAGGPLIYGANGFYGFWEDMLIEWHGASWRWLGDRVNLREDGSAEVSFEISLNKRPFLLLLRPHYYSRHMGYRYYEPWKKRPNPKAVSGWCSWEAYHMDVTQEKIAFAAEKMAELMPYGLEYIQLDDGYEQKMIPPAADGKIYESWLTPNKKFPGGHEKIVESIRKQGFVPAVWSNAVVTNEAAANAGLCMKEDGKAFRGDWIQYILNCTETTLREHVLPYYRGLRKFGYQYFKTDSIRHLYFDGLQECVRRGLLSEEEADVRFRGFLCCAREGIGEDAYLLSCWGMLTQAIGLVDASRIATDANPEWGRVQMQVYETARWFFAQRILFTLDPDHVCARTELEWARMLLSFVSLTGGVYMLSDPPESYDGDRMQIIRKTLPSLEVYAGETGPVDYTTPAFCWPAGQERTPEEESEAFFDDGRNSFGTLWMSHFCKGDRKWAVAMRIALSPLAEEDVPLDALGLDPEGEYAVYDFWQEKFLGIVTGRLGMRALPLGHVQVCALTPVAKDAPTLIASDRHVSMDAVSVIGCRSENGSLTLRLRGVPDKSFAYFIYSKQACDFSTDTELCVESEGPLYRVTVPFGEKEVKLTARQRGKTD